MDNRKLLYSPAFNYQFTKLLNYQIFTTIYNSSNMITGIHAIFYSPDADKIRAFLRDVLGLKSVDAGHGWLIFAVPPAEIAAHPTEAAEEPHHQLYLMCDDLKATIKTCKTKAWNAEQSWKSAGALSRLFNSLAEVNWPVPTEAPNGVEALTSVPSHSQRDF